MIQMVGKRWDETYKIYPFSNPKDKEVGKKLKQLDLNTATKKEIDEIIGNSSWTDLYCFNCKKCVEAAILLDLYYCKDCILKFLKQFG